MYDRDCSGVDRRHESPSESVAVSAGRSAVKDDSSTDAEADTTEETSELGDAGEDSAELPPTLRLEETQEVATLASTGDSDEKDDSDQASSAEEDEVGVDEEDECCIDSSTGPFLADIDRINTARDEVVAGSEEDSVRDSSMSTDSPTARLVATNDDDGDSDNDSYTEQDTTAPSVDDEYAASLEERKRILADASDRIRLRSELEGYLESLKALRGEDGEAVVEFPKNYSQILALMTEQDIRVEDCSSSTAGDKAKPPSAQQNWARVLIQTGLSKQQAFVSAVHTSQTVRT